jgi:uncharacterized delta-60 repeat protein
VVAATFDGYADESYSNAGIVVVSETGALSTAFSDDGVAKLIQPGFQRAGGVAVQPDGRIMLVGTADDRTSVGSSDMMLARFLASGELDSSFASGGLTTTDLRGSSDQGKDVQIGADGRIYASGSGGSDYSDFALARYEPDGQLDHGFGRDGVVLTNFTGPTSEDVAYDSVLDNQGRLLVAGNTDAPGKRPGTFFDVLGIARYETAPGPRDYDGDGLRDRVDRCDDLPARTRSGCPIYHGAPTIRYSRRIDDFSGRTLYGPSSNRPYECAVEARIVVYRSRAGRDEVIGRTRTGEGRGEWELSALVRRGRFYARVLRHRVRGLGICAAGESERLVVGRRR